MILSIKMHLLGGLETKKLMEVIVMCGKYDDFDPKIGKKVDFFH